MRFVIKILVSLCILTLCSWIVQKHKLPSLAGLIAVMPLTGFLVLIWVYLDNPGNFSVMTDYAKGALWGIVPSILFFRKRSRKNLISAQKTVVMCGQQRFCVGITP